MSTPLVTEKECILKHDPIKNFMLEWNNRWNTIVLSIIGGLLLLVGNLALNFYKLDSTIKMINTIDAQENRYQNIGR